MITDGKPTCLKEGIRYYKNSFGLDKKILNKTLTRRSVPSFENSSNNFYDCPRPVSQRICTRVYQNQQWSCLLLFFEGFGRIYL
jgi:hypothetical protein